VTAYVALLRGINVGRHRRVAMADIKKALAVAGHSDVTSVLQSGNLLLPEVGIAAARLETAIETALSDRLGLDIDVIVRSARALEKVLGTNPFRKRDVDPNELFVAFLKKRPPRSAVSNLEHATFGEDEFVLAGTEIYLRYPNGLGRSKMSAAFFERALSTRATVRNWRVINRLVELSRAASGPD
jgi:uncharacterized protein (DUF1697 family)